MFEEAFFSIGGDLGVVGFCYKGEGVVGKEGEEACDGSGEVGVDVGAIVVGEEEVLPFVGEKEVVAFGAIHVSGEELLKELCKSHMAVAQLFCLTIFLWRAMYCP